MEINSGTPLGGKRQQTTIIAIAVKITGSIATAGTVQVNGEVEGEIDCRRLIVGPDGTVAGRIVAEKIIVDGLVEGPIQAADVILKSNARVFGDIACQAIMIEPGAFVEGRLLRSLGLIGGTLDEADLQALEKARAEKARLLAASEASMYAAELVIEARHLSGNPDLQLEDALVFLAKRGHTQATALLASHPEQRRTKT